jgi:hypothetical protein
MIVMTFPTAGRAGLAVLAAAACSWAVWTAAAQTSPPATTTGQVRVRYAFQPDCLRSGMDAPCDTPRATRRLDFGPQIAVWVEKQDGSFIDTLMVTNATAVWGIGNRPGYWRFPSNWRFPYGKRTMALPIWAHARGRIYDSLVMQDDDGTNKKEQWLGFHEEVSTPDPYYCLSFRAASWVMDAPSVDAITCPTGMFNSAKGRFSTTEPRSYYPPRNDITKVGPNDCDVIRTNPCPHSSAAEFGELNDLDAVARATPRYGRVYNGIWSVPTDLAEGDYVLAVEVNKEFDTNSAHSHEAYRDPQLPDNGILNNIGQPSVVYKVPFVLDRKKGHQAAAADYVGYGDWDGQSGTLHPPDDSITSGKPGTGSGRLLAIARPAIAGGQPVAGRVHVTTEVPPSPEECRTAPADNGLIASVAVDDTTVTATEAVVNFVEAADRGQPVEQYEIRYREGDSMTLETFRESTPAPSVVPAQPGAMASVKLIGLKPSTSYTVGVRVVGGCVNEGPLKMATFKTKQLMFTQLSGCFVATATYGSTLAPEVEALRRLRDRLRARTPLAAAAVSLYERASPPMAGVLRESDVGRALVREALAPLITIVDTADRLRR